MHGTPCALYPTPPMMMKRLPSVDALRGLAVAGMLIIHQSEWWLTPTARRTGLFATLYFLSKLVAPIFLTLVGVALVLRFKGRPSHWSDLEPVLLRGLKILALGYVFNLAVWAPVWGLEEVANWDVLQLIGLSIIVCGLLLRTPWWARLVLALVVAWLSTTLTLRHLGFLPTYLADVVHGRTPPTYFPIVPWIAYVLGGTVLGEAYLKACPEQSRMARPAGRLSRLAALMAALGAGLLVVGAMGRPWVARFNLDELWLAEFSHPHPAQLAFASGAVLLLFAGLQALYARREPAWLRPLVVMGREALVTYILHHLVGYTLFHFLGWHDRFGFPAVVLMLLASFAVFYFVLGTLACASARWRRR
jgi:uncharacterized membrane protein